MTSPSVDGRWAILPQWPANADETRTARSNAVKIFSINQRDIIFRPWAQSYVEQLLCPQDWFSYWRLNCRLASYHAYVTGSPGYVQEDKVNIEVGVLWRDV